MPAIKVRCEAIFLLCSNLTQQIVLIVQLFTIFAHHFSLNETMRNFSLQQAICDDDYDEATPRFIKTWWRIFFIFECVIHFSYQSSLCASRIVTRWVYFMYETVVDEVDFLDFSLVMRGVFKKLMTYSIDFKIFLFKKKNRKFENVMM